MLSQHMQICQTIIDSHNVNVLDHILHIENYHSLLQKK